MSQISTAITPEQERQRPQWMEEALRVNDVAERQLGLFLLGLVTAENQTYTTPERPVQQPPVWVEKLDDSRFEIVTRGEDQDWDIQMARFALLQQWADAGFEVEGSRLVYSQQAEAEQTAAHISDLAQAA